jgi:glycosyltransferase involved in cell wall biosynthesis|tara:strand:- start:1523 stop:2521 length:999 start_codon:yes stop_codon:yes gene_type:complete
MKTIFLVGSILPPIGGITIHIDRLLNQENIRHEFKIVVFDLKKRTLLIQGKKTKNIIKILLFFITASIVHIHVSNNYLKLFFALTARMFLKKVIYTHHNSIISNKLIFRCIYRLCNQVILVNEKEIDEKLIDLSKTDVVPAFLPPYKFRRLPVYLETELKKFNCVISTNCFFYNLVNEKHVYGFDLIIEAFFDLTNSNKIQNTLLVIVDPSGSTKEFVESLLADLKFKSNKVFYVSKGIDFSSLIKKSSVTIRATRTDGDSLSVRESLYFNVPVIVSDVTERPEGSIIFKNEDSNDLAEKMYLALNCNDNYLYKHEDYGEKILEIYKKVLKG